ncbi:hypothetical protein [Mycobacterium sp. 852002-51163_SCH5372311]|uniref:hypothetical protein n=1 Tax=Mycobacterium sp. 852002-51163_SCH5372311 TaxID=1834097 RepID=UPI0018D2891E|nr:hypothetical protein [Mycobacterium sp. 852002-51163_SCH5372311]
MTRTPVGATGAFGFVAGHLSAVVIFDLCTGRTGNGRIRTAGAIDDVVGAGARAGGEAVVVLVVLDAAGGWWGVEWQPHNSAPRATTAAIPW